MFRDTPAPFHCQSCGEAAVSSVRWGRNLPSCAFPCFPLVMLRR
jgi:lipopolysaccharide-induced tumor necrosis factor-alpha factor